MAQAKMKKIPFHIDNSHWIDGTPYYKKLDRITLRKVKEFTVDENDVFECGFMRSGNSWLRTIVRAIMKQDNLEAFENTKAYFEESMPEYAIEIAETLERPECFWSHLQYHLLPSSLIEDKKGKIIYIMRNPKDVAVSNYYLHTISKFIGPWKGEWDVFYDAFFQGKIYYGDWFDHVRSFWKNRSEPNILFVKYEELRKDPHSLIRRLAEFMNRPVDDETLERIIRITEFSKMKKNLNLNIGDSHFFEEGSPFMRKGIVGDWKNFFNEKQTAEVDSKLDRFGEETGIYFQD